MPPSPATPRTRYAPTCSGTWSCANSASLGSPSVVSMLAASASSRRCTRRRRSPSHCFSRNALRCSAGSSTTSRKIASMRFACPVFIISAFAPFARNSAARASAADILVRKLRPQLGHRVPPAPLDGALGHVQQRGDLVAFHSDERTHLHDRGRVLVLLFQRGEGLAEREDLGRVGAE